MMIFVTILNVDVVYRIESSSMGGFVNHVILLQALRYSLQHNLQRFHPDSALG